MASANGRPRASWQGADNRSRCSRRSTFRIRSGLLYSAFTYYTGFKVNSGEYKVMGLAPYGEPKYARPDPRETDRPARGRLVPAEHEVLQLLHRPDHDQQAFQPAVRRSAAASPRAELTQTDMDLARSIQAGDRRGRAAHLARHPRSETGVPNLCLAGGVALNCVANGKLLRERVFERHLDPARGRRRGRRARRGACSGSTCIAGNDRQAERRARRHGRQLPWARIQRCRDRAMH